MSVPVSSRDSCRAFVDWSGKGAPGRAFAGSTVLRPASDEPSRQAVAGGRDLWSDEDRRAGVGARSAPTFLTRRSCLSAANAVSEASSAPRPLTENRSAVGAQRRPRNHEPPPSSAWRDAQALRATFTTRPQAENDSAVGAPNRPRIHALQPVSARRRDAAALDHDHSESSA